MKTSFKFESKVDFSDFKNALTDQSLITGGHFMIGATGQPILNAGTIASFKQAAELFTTGRSKGLAVHLGLFINDIGLTCESNNHCSLIKPNFSKEHFSLPDTYKDILDEYGIAEDELHLFWEKQIRNRGAQLFKQWKRQSQRILKDEIGYWLIDPEIYGRILLCRGSGIPTCPLIVAAFICEQQRQGFTSSFNLHYIGLDNMENMSNHFVVEKGKRVAELLATNASMKNIYFTHEQALVNF